MPALSFSTVEATTREVSAFPTRGPLPRPRGQSTRYSHRPGKDLCGEGLEDPMMHTGSEVLPGVRGLLQEDLPRLCHHCLATERPQQQGD